MTSGCEDHGCKGFGLGYATSSFKGKCGHKKYTTKHRVVYCKHAGIHPDDLGELVVRHKCDNARCINPLHLEVETHAENMQDMSDRGRVNKTGLSGILNGRCVLSDEQVVEIRRIRADSKTSYRELSERFGVGISQIFRIVKGNNVVTKLKAKEVPDYKKALMKTQGNKCPICGGSLLIITEPNRVLDHCHRRGFCRAVLCRGCNGGIGKIENLIKSYCKAGDSEYFIVKTLRNLADYLELHSTPQTDKIYHLHKSPAEVREEKNRKARLAASRKRTKEAKGG